MKGSLKFVGAILQHYHESQSMNITKLILSKTNKKKTLKTVRKTVKEIINVKNNSDVPNSLLIGETTATNATFIVDNSNTFLLQGLLLN